MTRADYRYMAREIRDLIPLLVHPQAIADLRLLAHRYEKLARSISKWHPANCLTCLSTGARRAEAH
jgi:hypothetical protein